VPPPILVVSGRREESQGPVAARQGPSQHPRGYEKCGLGHSRGIERASNDPRKVGLAIRFLDDRRAGSERLKP
jgi:hypothetical protein